MAELGRVLRLDARRAALLPAAVLLALAGVVIAWRALTPGIPSGDNALVALAAAVRSLGPLATALAAWAATRAYRLDHLRGLTSRSPATGPVLDLLLFTGAALLAYGAVALVIALETVLRQQADRPHPLGLLAGAAALALHVVFGYVAGRLVPHPVTAVAAGLLTGLWTILRDPGRPAWWNLLPPAVLGPVEPFTVLRLTVLTDQLLLSLGLIAALTLGYVWVVARGVLPALAMVAALAMTGIGAVRLESSDGIAMTSAARTDRVCGGWPLTICVRPAMRSALPALETALTPLAARLTGTPAAFTRAEQRPWEEPAGVRRGVAYFHIADLTQGYEIRTVQGVRDALVNAQACGAFTASYRDMIDAWLLDEEQPLIADTRIARRFARWGEAHRRVWFRRNFPAYRSCTLTAAHFR